jgi:hypothetical protein
VQFLFLDFVALRGKTQLGVDRQIIYIDLIANLMAF